MPYIDKRQQNAAKTRSRAKQMAEGRCIRCGDSNDRPTVNRRLCTACGRKDAREKHAARALQTQQLAAAMQLFANLQKRRKGGK
jgi:hypothetical protein